MQTADNPMLADRSPIQQTGSSSSTEEGLKHLALLTEYDGTAFSGWQTQLVQRTVQQVLRTAIMKLTGEPELNLVGCSRTDAGVHARGHVSHFATHSRIPLDRWPLAINSILPKDVSVYAAVMVPEHFNARCHALGKIYSYQIWNHRIRPAIDRNRYCHVPGALDLDALVQALPCLVGRRDFKVFCDSGSTARTTVRTVQRIRVTTNGAAIRLYFQGDGFLYHMVRIMAGTLLAVAQGKLTASQINGIIQSGDRKRAGKTMPPQGLCLEHVIYQPVLFGLWHEPAAREGDLDVQYALE